LAFIRKESPVLQDIVLDALASLILEKVFESLSNRIEVRKLVNFLKGGSPEQKAISKALKNSYEEFDRKYPELTHSLFDETFLSKPAVYGQFSQFLLPDPKPDSNVIENGNCSDPLYQSGEEVWDKW
jgi:hypothetical protein